LGTFTANRHDFKALLTQFTPPVRKLFDRCFIETKYTKLVKNVDWLKGGKLKAFSHHTPRIDENLANMKVTDDSWKPGKSVRQNKIVVCR